MILSHELSSQPTHKGKFTLYGRPAGMSRYPCLNANRMRLPLNLHSAAGPYNSYRLKKVYFCNINSLGIISIDAFCFANHKLRCQKQMAGGWECVI
jgi:hypothetical protein